MADQTSVTARLDEHQARGEPTPATALAHNVGDFARDLVNLAELQAQLLAVDLKQSARQAAARVGLVAVGLALVLACLPVLLMALAYALIEVASWSHGLSFLVAGVVGLLMGGALALGGLAWLRRTQPSWERSRRELGDNLRWLKQSLSATGRQQQRRQCE